MDEPQVARVAADEANIINNRSVVSLVVKLLASPVNVILLDYSIE